MATKRTIQKTIYSELLRECPEDFDEALILLKAKELVSFVSADLTERTDKSPSSRNGFSLRLGRVPFDLLETDIAMNDGGWRVMGKENLLMGDFYEEDGDPISSQLYIDEWLLEHAA